MHLQETWGYKNVENTCYTRENNFLPKFSFIYKKYEFGRGKITSLIDPAIIHSATSTK